jgi:hypothetical protein
MAFERYGTLEHFRTLEHSWELPATDAELLEPLIAALNNEPIPGSKSIYRDPDAVKRLSKLVETLQQLHSFSLELRGVREFGSDHELTLEKHLARSNDLLAKYRMQPRVGWFPKYGVWTTNKVHFASAALNARYSRPVETGLVQPLLQTFQQHKINRIRRCLNERCSRWFYAQLSHKRFCCQRCKRKHHESTPEFKAQRRAYMRDRYHKFEKKVFPSKRGHRRKKG